MHEVKNSLICTGNAGLGSIMNNTDIHKLTEDLMKLYYLQNVINIGLTDYNMYR
jgi:hypothetical protein